MDIQRLKDALMGIKDQKADDDLSDRMGSPEIPFSPLDAAATEQTNSESEGPNTKTKDQLIKDQVEQEAAKTVPGQIEQARDTASVPNNPAPQSQLQKLQEQMTQLRTDDDAKITEARNSDRNRMMVANAIKGLGTLGQAELQRKSGVSGGIDKFQAIKGEDTASALVKDRDSKLGELQNQLKMMQKAGKDDMTKYQKKSLEIQSKRLGLMDTKEGRLTKKDAFREKVGNRLSDAEIKKITEIDDGTRMLDEIDELFKSDDVKKHLGPIDSKLAYMQKFTSEQPQGYVKMHQAVGLNLASYIKSISGAAVSEPEAIRLGELVPTVSDNPGEFKAKLDFFRKELKQSKQDYLRNIGQQKTGAEKFKSESGQTSEIDKRIQKVMDANPGSTYEQVKKALKAKGKL